MQKQDTIRIITSSCHFGFWLSDLNKNGIDSFDDKTFPHMKLFIKCLSVFKNMGFKIGPDESVDKIIRKHYKYGKWNELEVSAEVFPVGFRFEFYQNINTGDREKGDGKYCYDKYKLMPYLTKKKFELCVRDLKITCMLERNVDVEFGDPSKLAEQAIIKDKQGTGHNTTAVTSLNDFQAQMKDYDLRQNNNDRDKKKIVCGDMKYFRDTRTGRLTRGRVYHNLNNQWYVLINKFSRTGVSSYQLFDPTPEDFALRRFKEKRIPSDRQRVFDLQSGKINRILPPTNDASHKGKRTGLDFSKHELIIKDRDGLLVHDLKINGSSIHRVVFINTEGILSVTGDFGNWIFCREFHPSDGENSGVSDSYWKEKIQISSTQQTNDYDSDGTEKLIKEKLSEFDSPPFSEREQEQIDWFKEISRYTDESKEVYLQKAYESMPSFLDYESIPLSYKTKPQLQCIFDAFEEVCYRLRLEKKVKQTA